MGRISPAGCASFLMRRSMSTTFGASGVTPSTARGNRTATSVRRTSIRIITCTSNGAGRKSRPTAVCCCHAQGPEQVWPVCIECQLKAGNAGDFVLIGGPGITVDGIDRQNVDKQFVVVDKKAATSEKPAGQWNSYDIHCKGRFHSLLRQRRAPE